MIKYTGFNTVIQIDDENELPDANEVKDYSRIAIDDNNMYFIVNGRWRKFGTGVSPSTLTTVGKNGSQFNSNESSTPINDAINNILLNISNNLNDYRVLKIYPGLYNEKIILKDRIILRGFNDSSIIENDDDYIIVIEEPGNYIIKDMNINSTNSPCLLINNENAKVIFDRCKFNTTYNEESVKQLSTIIINGGNIEFIDCYFSFINTNKTTEIKDQAIIKLEGNDLINLNIKHSKFYLNSSDSSDNISCLMNTNTNSNNEIYIDDNKIELICSEILGSDNAFSLFYSNGGNASSYINNNFISFEVESSKTNTLVVPVFIYDTPSNTSNNYFKSNIIELKNINENYYYLGCAAKENDKLYCYENIINKSFSKSPSRYIKAGDSGQFEWGSQNLTGVGSVSTDNSFYVPFSLVNTTWNSISSSGYQLIDNNLPNITFSTNSSRYFTVTFGIPFECAILTDMLVQFIPYSSPASGCSITYTVSVAKPNSVPVFQTTNSVVITNPNYTGNLNKLHENSIIDSIPSGLRNNLSGSILGVKVTIGGSTLSNWNSKFLGILIKYKR